MNTEILVIEDDDLVRQGIVDILHTNHGMTATLYSFPALMFRNLMKGTVTPRRKGWSCSKSMLAAAG